MTNAKKILAMVLCTVMCLSLLPIWALAEESIEPADNANAELLQEEQIQEEVYEEPAEDTETEATIEEVNVPNLAEEIETEAVDQEEVSTEEAEAETESAEVVEPTEVTENSTDTAEEPVAVEDTAEETPVAVVFNATPEDAAVTVYTKSNPDDSEEKTVIDPEEDGSYLLPPGEYYYTVLSGGEYQDIEEDTFTVTKDNYPVYYMDIVLEKVAPVGNEQAEPNTNETAGKQPEAGTDESPAVLFAEGAEFVDVTDPSAYYYTPVYWAVERGITSGKTATTFAPYDSCTRAQVMAFLYKAMGSPAVSGSNPFTDVKESDYFYKPVLWAVENKITSGTSATTFGPYNTCTRAQVMAFLYKANGSPEISGSNPFTDVKESDYFYKPVLWAVANGITNGTSATTFSPYNTCTRAQVMTFLYKAMSIEPAVSNLTYEDTSSTTVCLIRYDGDEAVVKIPETYQGKTVTEIAPDAFLNNTTITSIDLPDTIEVIGARAFKGCTNLYSMN